jgi:hypothetical protein
LDDARTVAVVDEKKPFWQLTMCFHDDEPLYDYRVVQLGRFVGNLMLTPGTAMNELVGLEVSVEYPNTSS